MKMLTFLFCVFGLTTSLLAQDLYITFTGTGESTVVDSITATNQTTGEYVMLPGNETLILSSGAIGIGDHLGFSEGCKLYPNPFENSATIRVNQAIEGNLNITFRNLTGQVIMQKTQYLLAGKHLFTICTKKPGIYILDIESKLSRRVVKAVSITSKGISNHIEYIGGSPDEINITSGILKNFDNLFILNYSPGDFIHYKGQSGKHTIIFTDITNKSQNYEFEFIDCTDIDETTYDIVKIGDQIWMEDNLAYLPQVSLPSEYSDSDPYYYVYGYEGNITTEAKATDNYMKYGVLYNWDAAMTSCPEGWHLPSDNEWIILAEFLINNGFGFRGSGSDIGKSMASISGWLPSATIGSIGNDQSSNNSSGFNALPGGQAFEDHFALVRHYALFWSSTGKESVYAWTYDLSSFFNNLDRGYSFRKVGKSVRCIKD